jgi:hypothetical protein
VSVGWKGAASLLAAVAIILLAAIYGSAVLVSSGLAPDLTGAELDAAGIDDATERLAQQEARRQRRDELFGTVLNGGLQLVAGLALGVGAVATWRTLRLTQIEGETDRFTKAAELLGHERRSARASGVYALGRMVADNEADRATVVDLLCAYVREHSPESDTPDSGIFESGTRLMLAVRAVDVQAAVTVLGRISDTQAPIYLPFANLAGANLKDGILSGAVLSGVDLSYAFLGGAVLPGAILSGADLTRAVLTAADLTGADLTRADLTGADLTGANLTRANLGGANLTGANLGGANLTGARADVETLWPEGFDAQEHETFRQS